MRADTYQLSGQCQVLGLDAKNRNHGTLEKVGEGGPLPVRWSRKAVQGGRGWKWAWKAWVALCVYVCVSWDWRVEGCSVAIPLLPMFL